MRMVKKLGILVSSISFFSCACSRCVESESQWAEIQVSPLQLAVMSRQPEVVELLLSTASEVGLLGEVLMAGTVVSFEEDVLNYGGVDQMLHGASAFHLGVRFGRGALRLMITFLENRGEKRILADAIIRKSDNHMKRTPLHCAAHSGNPKAIR